MTERVIVCKNCNGAGGTLQKVGDEYAHQRSSDCEHVRRAREQLNRRLKKQDVMVQRKSTIVPVKHQIIVPGRNQA